MSSNENEKKKWNPPRYLTICCDDIIWSRIPGEFRRCECGKTYVDQTPNGEAYITRHSGELVPFPEETNE